MSTRRERVRPRQEPKPPDPINVDGDRLLEMMANVADGQTQVVALLVAVGAELAALRLVLARCVEQMGLQEQVTEEKSRQ